MCCVKEPDGQDTLAIGCAAGFGGDRTDAALPIVETLFARGGAGILMFEMLAECTLALAQIERRKNPERGYSPLLKAMVRPVLRRCVESKIPIVSNFGAANPRAAATLIRSIAHEQNISNIRIAIVEGDDLSDANGRMPHALAGHIPFVIGLLSMPLSLLFIPIRFISACCPWS